MLRRMLIAVVLVGFLSGCGTQNPVAPPRNIPATSYKATPKPVPPVKAENYLAPEPDDVELGPRG